MTLIALWSPDPHMLWCVADTRISDGMSTLTDRGTKIIPLTMNCYGPSAETGFFSDILFRRTFGFCYAGSSLIAHLAVDTLIAALGTLARTADVPPPSMADIGSLAARLMTAYLKDVGTINPNTSTEAAIFGRCPQSNILTIVHLTQKTGPNDVHVTSSILTPSTTPLLLGGPEVKASFKDVFSSHDPSREPMAPFVALDDLISSEKLQSVGGTCQLGVVLQDDCQLFAIVPQYKRDQPPAPFKFVGFDLQTEIGDVGTWRIGLTGFAGPPYKV